MTEREEAPRPGEADDPRRRDPAWVLGEALRLAAAIWENEDRNVERDPGYDADVTMDAAVELAGAVKALDGLLQAGYPIPHAWRKVRPARPPGLRVRKFRLGDWRSTTGAPARDPRAGDTGRRLVSGLRTTAGRLAELITSRRSKRG
ncbi:MAG: hypothetical protein ACRDYV_10035 [Acidimicrobiia bacterium]